MMHEALVTKDGLAPSASGFRALTITVLTSEILIPRVLSQNLDVFPWQLLRCVSHIKRQIFAVELSFSDSVNHSADCLRKLRPIGNPSKNQLISLPRIPTQGIRSSVKSTSPGPVVEETRPCRHFREPAIVLSCLASTRSKGSDSILTILA